MLNVRIQTPEVQKLSPKITVVGIGGAGGNAVNNMISSGLEGCEFLVCNTDAQALEGSLCDDRIQLGASVTGGLGAGAKPEIGQQSAMESLDDVMQYLDGSNMAFITAGMGGGTGTGAAPVIAKACRDNGILTVGVVTKPFHFEGTHRMKQAEAGIEEMQDYVDTLIVIPNQNLFRIANEKTTFAEAFKMADGVLQSGVRGVTDLMVMPGLINLDFADIRSAMIEMGKAMMGTGEAEGERRAIEAAEAAINNPLLDDVSMKGARGVIINVTGGHDMTLYEVDEACNRIRDEVDPNANIIFGSTFDDSIEGMMRVSVVATGIDAAMVEKSMTKRSGGFVASKPIQMTAPVEKKESNAPTLGQRVRSDNLKIKPDVARNMTLTARQSVAAASSHSQAQASTQTSQLEKTTGMAEAEADMFEQGEFHAHTAAPSSTNARRGSVQQGYFIPPTPVVPEPQEAGHFTSSGMSYAMPQQQQSVQPAAPTQTTTPAPQPQQSVPVQEIKAPPKPVQDPIPAPTQTLVLRPPVSAKAQPQETAAPRSQKSQSFFDRIAGAYKGIQQNFVDQEDHFDQSETSGSQKSSGTGGFHGSAMRATRTQAEPSQGQLNIESPSAPPKNNDQNDLDIPAFLRRQAN